MKSRRKLARNDVARSRRAQSPILFEMWGCLALGLLILIFYSNSFTAGLLFDSEFIVGMDPRLRTLNWTNLEQIFTRSYWWPTQESNLYRPLTTLSYLFNYAILGNAENVAGYHVVNFLLHWANAWLVLLIVRRLAGRFDIAALTASLFAVHPVNTEAVTNIVGRADLLAALGVLFGGWCYLRATLPGTRKGRWFLFMGVAACAGVLAKENAVMIVGFVALYDVLWRWPMPGTKGWHERLQAVFQEFGRGYGVLMSALLLIWLIRRWVISTTFVFEEFFTDNPIVGAAPFQGFMTAMGVIGRYLKLLAFPRTLSSDYSFNQIPLYGTGNPGSDTLAWISLAAGTLLLAAAIYLRVRQKIFSWAMLFLFIMMLPTSNLVVTIGSIMAERFLYLPSIGFCAVSALVLCSTGEKLVSLTRANARFAPVLRWILPIAVICVLGVRTFLRNGDWQDYLSLSKSAAAASPASYKAHMIYGDAILADADQKNLRLEQVIDEAIAHEEIARSILETEPPLPLKWQNNRVYLQVAKDYRIKGQSLQDTGHRDEALSFYQKSLAALTKAQEVDRFTNQASREFRLRCGIPPKEIPDIGNALIYESLCLTYLRLEQWEKCEAAGQYAQHIAPQQASGYQLVGAAYFKLGRYADAATQFLAAVMMDPANPDLWTNLSASYERLGVQPNPVWSQGSSFSLNRDLPSVRQHLNQTAAMVVRLFDEAKKFDEVRELRTRLIKEYSVLPEAFSRK